jgi:hypothetical protein
MQLLHGKIMGKPIYKRGSFNGIVKIATFNWKITESNGDMRSWKPWVKMMLFFYMKWSGKLTCSHGTISRPRSTSHYPARHAPRPGREHQNRWGLWHVNMPPKKGIYRYPQP